jgi:hypothetical protein
MPIGLTFKHYSNIRNMQVFSKEELEILARSEETNNRMEEFFIEKREKWNSTIEPLFKVMKENFAPESTQKIIDIQASALSFRQVLNEEISLFLNKRTKEDVKLKKLKQDKFLFYATGFGLKTNMGEKSILIDAHTAQAERAIQLIDTHIEFLRASSKNLESLGYAIKTIIELFNYLK